LANGDLSAELVTVAGRRVPVVSVHDGEPGLLDNIGSIVGVKQISCAVRKHSKCGRPKEIYHLHGIDAEAIVEAVGQCLSETALENVRVASNQVSAMSSQVAGRSNWQELWAKSDSH
jgi:pyruvate dehydrogenase E1 component